MFYLTGRNYDKHLNEVFCPHLCFYLAMNNCLQNCIVLKYVNAEYKLRRAWSDRKLSVLYFLHLSYLLKLSQKIYLKKLGLEDLFGLFNSTVSLLNMLISGTFKTLELVESKTTWNNADQYIYKYKLSEVLDLHRIVNLEKLDRYKVCQISRLISLKTHLGKHIDSTYFPPF